MKSLLAALFMLTALVSGAAAVEKEPFDEVRFDALRSAGEVVLVDVFAEWCSTCARQQEVIKAYVADNPDRELHILEVNFDRDKEWVRHFRAPRQSTLLLYSGEDQIWFSVAETRPEVIKAEFDKAFAAAGQNDQ